MDRALALCMIVIAVIAVGLHDTREYSSELRKLSQTELPPPVTQGDCGRAQVIHGEVALALQKAIAYTNSLLYIPACPTGQSLMLSGTEVQGVGAAVTVSGEGASTYWSGVIKRDALINVSLPAGQGAFVSFTNDVQRGDEDRNFTLEIGFP